MRPILFTLVLLSAAAYAQQDYYLGGSIGLTTVLGFIGAPAEVHFGVSDIEGTGVGVRADVLAYLTGSGVQFGVNALGEEEGLFAGATSYYGAGARFLIETGSGTSLFGVGTIAGIEFGVDEQIGVFIESRADLFFPGVYLIGVGAGVNVHF